MKGRAHKAAIPRSQRLYALAEEARRAELRCWRRVGCWKKEVRQILDQHALTLTDVRGPSIGRSPPEIAKARREIMAMLRKRGWSMPKIAAFLRLHHTTVLYGLRRYNKGEG